MEITEEQYARIKVSCGAAWQRQSDDLQVLNAISTC